MWSSIKKEAFTNCADFSTEVGSQEMDTKVHPDKARGFHEQKNVASTGLCSTADQKPAVDVTHGQKAPNTVKVIETRRPANKRSHVCCSCFKSFANNNSLQRHFRTRCKPRCAEVFPYDTGIAEHNAAVQVVSSEMFICEHCSKSFSGKADFNQHVDLEHGVEQTSHNCYLCPEAFDDALSLRTHLNAHVLDSNKQHSDGLKCERVEHHDDLSEPNYSCSVCGVMFADDYILAEHVLIAHSPELPSADEKPLLSDLCLDICEVVDNLDDSVDESSGVPAHNCNLCPESFEDASSLAEHVQNDHFCASSPLGKEQEEDANRHQRTSFRMATRQNKKPVAGIHHACHLCPEGFADSTTLQRHVRTVHSAVTKRSNTKSPSSSKRSGFKETHSCNQCSKSFRSKGHLTRHQMTHTLSRPFRCHLCPATFAQKGILKRHIQRHIGYKRFTCPHCSKGFLIKAEMHIHIRTHTGERPYVCDVCPAAFSARDNLRKHVATHTGIRPFSCPQCPRSFVRYQDLKRHSRRHTGERPFACTWCPRTFTRRNLLREHIEAAHQNITSVT